MLKIIKTNSEKLLKLPFLMEQSPSYMISVEKGLYNIIEQESLSIIKQIFNSDIISSVKNITPKEMLIGNESEKPHFFSLDFALTLEKDFPIKLIELQGFPSVLSSLTYIAKKCHGQEILNEEAFKNIILGDEPIENTIMLDIEPLNSKTRHDFILSEMYYGISTVCISDVIEKEGKFYYRSTKSSKIHQIKRVYNRLIKEDIANDNLLKYKNMVYSKDINWITHPNWFYLISKSCLPLLEGRSILKARIYNSKNDPLDFDTIVKPIWGFGGEGFLIDGNKSGGKKLKNGYYLEQEKTEYSPIKTPESTELFFEIRVNLIWDDFNSEPLIHSLMARCNDRLPISMDKTEGKKHCGFSYIPIFTSS